MNSILFLISPLTPPLPTPNPTLFSPKSKIPIFSFKSKPSHTPKPFRLAHLSRAHFAPLKRWVQTELVHRGGLSPLVATLAGNPTFMAGLVAWTAAQTAKMVLNSFVERKWEFGVLFSSGGMPSSHSALCTALTTAVALCHGVADSLFPVCLGFSLIVMYDATGVRRHAGIQAQVLNVIVADLFQGHPISQRKLKELLGHTLSQVIAGALLGILVACICCQGCRAPF